MLQINYLEIHHDFLTTLPSETLDAIKPYIQSEWKNYSSDKETANKGEALLDFISMDNWHSWLEILQ